MDKHLIKQRINPETYLSLMGVSSYQKISNNRLKFNCLLHEDKTPSCVVNTNGTIHCYSCQFHGDVLDYHQNLTKSTFTEALKDLSSLMGLTWQETNYKAKKPIKDKKIDIARDFTDNKGNLIYKLVKYQGEDHFYLETKNKKIKIPLLSGLLILEKAQSELDDILANESISKVYQIDRRNREVVKWEI